ncbi:hypothetical protein SPONN_2586 [uncultured Candidatus Thioglobus sp.]|nr:hypothetical protein SPONN_2586 [uncultured Candidatus Thioglobus sp.]SMM98886.1 hypothetical protein SPONL_212 [uncultured Candidatus Thioglobus sp.]
MVNMDKICTQKTNFDLLGKSANNIGVIVSFIGVIRASSLKYF